MNVSVISIVCVSPAEEEDSAEEEEVEACADTSRVEEIPPKEPLFNAVPLKSALKKRPGPGASPAATPLAPRQDHHHASFKSVSLSHTPPHTHNRRVHTTKYYPFLVN